MDSEKIKEYQLKAEGFAEGMKWGVNQTLQWIANELAKEQVPPPEEKKE